MRFCRWENPGMSLTEQNQSVAMGSTPKTLHHEVMTHNMSVFIEVHGD